MPVRASRIRLAPASARPSGRHHPRRGDQRRLPTSSVSLWSSLQRCLWTAPGSRHRPFGKIKIVIPNGRRLTAPSQADLMDVDWGQRGGFGAVGASRDGPELGRCQGGHRDARPGHRIGLGWSPVALKRGRAGGVGVKRQRDPVPGRPPRETFGFAVSATVPQLTAAAAGGEPSGEQLTRGRGRCVARYRRVASPYRPIGPPTRRISGGTRGAFTADPVTSRSEPTAVTRPGKLAPGPADVVRTPATLTAGSATPVIT
jgi:hypothetical protein